MRKHRMHALGASIAGLALVVASCGGDDEELTGSGSVTVGGANFPEMQIMQEMYRTLLEEAGYDVTITTAETREIYAPALQSGELDVIPEYAATLAEYLNAEINGPDAPSDAPVATTDAAETVGAMQPLAEEFGVVVLEPSQANSSNGFAVSQEFADANGGIATLTELGELGLPLVLAAGEECPERPFCQPGLEDRYNLNITEILPLGFGSVQTKEAVLNDDAQLGLVGTTDGTLSGLGLVLLEDDQNLQLADNLVPVANADAAEDAALVEALNALSAVLTTEDLTVLNDQMTAERLLPEEIARNYLEDKGLI